MLGGVDTLSGDRICRPDPEEMLQRARERLEQVNKELEAYKNFVRITDHIPHSDEAAVKILGALTLKQMSAEIEVERWLEEIDKD